MAFTTADGAILLAAAIGAVTGVFVGFSGMLSFLAGLAAAVSAGCAVWSQVFAVFGHPWSRLIALLVLCLLVFGIVRWTVQRFVRVLIAQPGDSILGCVAGAVSIAVIAIACVWVLNDMQPVDADFSSRLLEVALSCVGR